MFEALGLTSRPAFHPAGYPAGARPTANVGCHFISFVRFVFWHLLRVAAFSMPLANSRQAKDQLWLRSGCQHLCQAGHPVRVGAPSTDGSEFRRASAAAEPQAAMATA